MRAKDPNRYRIAGWKDVWKARGFVAIESKFCLGIASAVKCEECGKEYLPQSAIMQMRHQYKHIEERVQKEYA